MAIFDLTGKTVVVTGAGSGIGRATAVLVAAQGASVVVADIAESAHGTVTMITDDGGSARAVVGDISDPAVAASLIEDGNADGTLWGLVNNAGVMDLFAGVSHVDDATWERCLRINLTAPMYLMRAAVPVLVENGGGSIVNMSSAAGMRGAAAGAAYTASKHGLIGLTRNTAYTYGKLGVRCNAVMPGGVETNIMASIDQTKLDTEHLGALGPVHASALRNAKPDELAVLVLFLLSAEASNVNGALIANDGGWSAG
ncbi:MAG TPA: SDR family oxidoreductase [Propionibacterium sp.]|nr:SDR family oxidoreductase [Propionibacterium sp.]